MSTHAQDKDDLSDRLEKVCDRGYFLLTSFVFSASVRDVKGIMDCTLMAGKDVAKLLSVEMT